MYGFTAFIITDINGAFPVRVIAEAAINLCVRRIGSSLTRWLHSRE
jgi:hypothetical protein